MAISHSSPTFLFVITLFSHVILISSASSTDKFSPSSSQIKFWYENVKNKMPNSIMKKLSPLSKESCDLFTTNMISKNQKFIADSNFCSLANLACTASDLQFSPAQTNIRWRIYGAGATHHIITKENRFFFFRLSTLKVGNLVHLSDLKNYLPDRAFLPNQFASQVSISSTDEITRIFSDSAKKEIETTISYCNAETIEKKSCLKSLEEMISFAKTTIGGKKLLALSSRSTKGSNKELMIKNIIKYNADKSVVCHEVFLPFATYYCHLLSSTNLYKVELVEPKTGVAVNTMIATCHMDTSTWSANHLSFQILKFEPGQGEACHWFTQIDLAWINADGNSV